MVLDWLQNSRLLTSFSASFLVTLAFFGGFSCVFREDPSFLPTPSGLSSDFLPSSFAGIGGGLIAPSSSLCDFDECNSDPVDRCA